MKSMKEIKDVSSFAVVTDIGNGDIRPSDITVEHRMNNSRRGFLFVNQMQCKHIPYSPTNMMNMCKKLAYKITSSFDITHDDKVLVIGFAETATAIANFVADEMYACKYVLMSTREELSKSNKLIEFREEHSHAAEHSIYAWDLCSMFRMLAGMDAIRHNIIDMLHCNKIVIIDDEITTGNTVLNLVKELKRVVADKQIKFYCASICNWMDSERRKKFRDADIGYTSLIRGELREQNELDVMDGLMRESIIEAQADRTVNEMYAQEIYVMDVPDLLSDMDVFKTEKLGHAPYSNDSMLLRSLHKLAKHEMIQEATSIRIVGTEEFMYMPILFGHLLENAGKSVLVHATTRSPIDVLNDDYRGAGQAIKNRVEMRSVYGDRKTYLYNTGTYTDLVIVMTDAKHTEESHKSMLDIARSCRSDKMMLIYV